MLFKDIDFVIMQTIIQQAHDLRILPLQRAKDLIGYTNYMRNRQSELKVKKGIYLFYTAIEAGVLTFLLFKLLEPFFISEHKIGYGTAVNFIVMFPIIYVASFFHNASEGLLEKIRKQEKDILTHALAIPVGLYMFDAGKRRRLRDLLEENKVDVYKTPFTV